MDNTISHTFLFAELVGFTVVAETEGDARALEVVLVIQRRVRSLLKEHAAEQVKAIGDGLMLRCVEPRAAIALGLRLVRSSPTRRTSRRCEWASIPVRHSPTRATGMDGP